MQAVRKQTVTGNSQPMTFDVFQTPFSATVQIAISGTATCKVQVTADDPKGFADLAAFQAGAAWYDHATLTGVTANATGMITGPVYAARTVVSAVAGTVTTTFLQAGI